MSDSEQYFTTLGATRLPMQAIIDYSKLAWNFENARRKVTIHGRKAIQVILGYGGEWNKK